MKKNILVTGSAGFIGFSVCKKLIDNETQVIGIDNVNNYYDTNLKEKRLKILKETSLRNNNWQFIKADLINKSFLMQVFEKYKPETVINLAAQAGVRYSLENPGAYINSNIVGFANVLECCKTSRVKSLLYASSSSVYGGNTKIPYAENDSVNHPVSIYGATKRSNELMAHAFSHLYDLPCTGIRFFTVYGPWGRPDMAPMLFADAITKGKTIKIFNHGNMSRSFTFIDDVVNIIMELIKKPALPDKSFNTNNPNASSSWCPHRILNVGNDNAVGLLEFINLLEQEIGLKSIKSFEKLQDGDVINTLSDNTLINEWIGTHPKTSIRKGIKIFVDWYKDYYK